MSMTATTLPFGKMNVSHLFNTDSLQNIGRRSTRWQILEAFLRNAEGTVDRLVEGATGFIVLIGIPGQPNSSMFHIFDEGSRSFFLVDFEFQETFNPAQFEAVLQHYDLSNFINLPVAKTQSQKVSTDVAPSERKQRPNKWVLHTRNARMVYHVNSSMDGVAHA